MNFFGPFLFLSLLSLHNLCAQEIAFVLSKDIDKREFKVEYIEKIYLKQKRFWDSGQKIRVIQRELGSSEREYFRKTFLNISEMELLEYWIEKKQKLGLSKPMTMKNDSMVAHIVATLDGAIGYINIETLEERVVKDKVAAGLIKVGNLKVTGTRNE